VVAAVRDPTHNTSVSLSELAKGPSSSLVVVKIDSLSETDAAAAIDLLAREHGVTSLDLVIANAGVATGFPTVHEAQTADLLHHFQVNVVANVVLWRAVRPLLLVPSGESPISKKFVVMGSTAGTIEWMEKAPVPNAVYGTSKAALHYITKKIHTETDDLIVFPVHPG
jgi:norsolorinic acid ketoreductase